MKNSLQNIINNSTSSNQIRNLKRKRNCSGKENIDPVPHVQLKKEAISNEKSITKLPIEDENKQRNSIFNALIEVAQVEYDFLRIDSPKEELNAVARTLLDTDPFLNHLCEDIKLLPSKIQLLVSEFHDLDSEETIKNYQLKTIKSALKCEKEITLFSDYSKEQLLKKIDIVLLQRQVIMDKKVAKATQIKELIETFFENKPKQMNETQVINNFKHKIKRVKQSKKDIEKDVYDKELSSSDVTINESESSPSSVSSNVTMLNSDDENKENECDVGRRTSKAKYCLCKKKASGQMVLCDNKQCKIGWFHFKCVNIKSKPKGNWFCNKCKRANKK